tara:strand:+ start:1159 stop:1692 length:534 start_codon:yes stop_codon:yes gene_type:complete
MAEVSGTFTDHPSVAANMGLGDGAVAKLTGDSHFTGFVSLEDAEGLNITGFKILAVAAYGNALSPPIIPVFSVSLTGAGGTSNFVAPDANFPELPTFGAATAGGPGELWGHSAAAWSNVDFSDGTELTISYSEPPPTSSQVIYLDHLLATVYFTTGVQRYMQLTSGLVKISEGLIKL